MVRTTLLLSVQLTALTCLGAQDRSRAGTYAFTVSTVQGVLPAVAVVTRGKHGYHGKGLRE